MCGQPGLIEREFEFWVAYWQLEPFGEEWAQTAQLCSVIATFRPFGSGRVVPSSVFMPRVSRPASTNLHAKFLAAAAAAGFSIVEAPR